jgi:hypothetical protein
MAAQTSMWCCVSPGVRQKMCDGSVEIFNALKAANIDAWLAAIGPLNKHVTPSTVLL